MRYWESWCARRFHEMPHVRLSLQTISVLLLVISMIESFSVQPCIWRPRSVTHSTRLRIYAPPGSGYAGPEDEESHLPDTYEPMMEYPGTMRPGRTPENMPFQDLPIGDNDPDPVPWPHFQQIEWHHRWDPPHEHPTTIEAFIEQQGRWATPEMEAAMRAGVRRDVRERREAAEAEKRDTIITDDEDEDDDTMMVDDVPIALGDGIFGQLGSTADQAATAAATSPDREEDEEGKEDESFDDGLDNFLLDLGLDAELEDDADSDSAASATSAVDDDDDDDGKGAISMKSDGGSVTASINVEDDGDLDLGLDDDDELEGDTVPLEDFGDSDVLDTEDIFDEGGFDYDDGDFDGGDEW